MDASATLRTVLESPFPGLRAFGIEESILFFGRETHTAELLRRLSESRFLAITGPSGCGKSSLVYAGLLPELYRGYLVKATSRWRFATFRPGNAPIDALAAALAKEGALSRPLDVESLRAMLGATSGGLVEAVRWAGLAPGESLLVVADQFEELFRFATEGREGASERSLFVSLLLHAVESDAPIYVALTMRSEYQGACSQFPGLPEALNRSQYLVSRMTREQYRQAIVRPLELVEVGITPRLVNQLLNDTGNDPDQLPVLQHALLRTYRHWKAAGRQGDIDLVHYQAKEVGGIETALALHGDGILARFPNEPLAEKIFRCLTGPEGRRPKELQEIYDIVKATSEPVKARVNAIIAAFAHPDDSLLMLSSSTLESDTVADITHESLIRKWPTLKEWVREESKSAEWYGDLARDVVRKRTGDAGLWQDPELSTVLERYNREGWNKDWALQYRPSGDPPFGEVENFLDDSTTAQAKRRRRERLAGRLLLALLATVALAISVIYFRDQQHDRTERELSAKFLDLQKAQSEEQKRANYYEEQVKATERKLLEAKDAEQSALRAELSRWKNAAKESQAKANDYQSKTAMLRQTTPAPVISNDAALLDRIEKLQEELDTVTKARDELKARVESLTKAQSQDVPELVNRVNQLIAQAANLELRLAELQRVAVPPTFVDLAQYSVQHISLTPSAGRIAVGVGGIDDFNPRAELQLYVWTSSSSLPKVYSENEGEVSRLLAPLKCSSGRTDGRLCLNVRRIDVDAGRQAPINFALEDVRYQIRVAKWSDSPDEISLLVYALPPDTKSAS